MRHALTWEVAAPARFVAPAGLRQKVMLAIGFALPVPLLAATGLTLPLPDGVFRLASAVVERTAAIAKELPAVGSSDSREAPRPVVDQSRGQTSAVPQAAARPALTPAKTRKRRAASAGRTSTVVPASPGRATGTRAVTAPAKSSNTPSSPAGSAPSTTTPPSGSTANGSTTSPPSTGGPTSSTPTTPESTPTQSSTVDPAPTPAPATPPATPKDPPAPTPPPTPPPAFVASAPVEPTSTATLVIVKVTPPPPIGNSSTLSVSPDPKTLLKP
jgi:hypothetical protein